MQGDIFATKGIEYLITVVYLLLLAGLAWGGTRRSARAPARRAPRRIPWFSVPDGFAFHQGHAWAAAADAGGGDVKVGLDDFAARLLGAPDGLELPGVGAALLEGARAWTVRAGGRELPMLSPVEGEVVAVNPAALATPRLAAEDPYGRGWLLQVRVRDRAGWRHNLLSGTLARSWMRLAADRLRELLPQGLGLGETMADGGAPVRGFGRALNESQWEAVERDFFLVA